MTYLARWWIVSRGVDGAMYLYLVRISGLPLCYQRRRMESDQPTSTNSRVGTSSEVKAIWAELERGASDEQDEFWAGVRRE